MRMMARKLLAKGASPEEIVMLTELSLAETTLLTSSN
ncbi:MAG: hypothetical protein K0Q74_266 [Gammaproteobacteria bacterium]|jgi:hypothetical protein|nr:hypothetical protein [Gammaproteobacteria bacterium]